MIKSGSGDLSFGDRGEGYITLHAVDERYHTRKPGQYIIALTTRKRRASIEWCDVDHARTFWQST